MKKLIIIFSLFLVLFLFVSCKKEEPIETKKEENIIQEEDIIFPYESLKDEDFDIEKFDLNDIPLVFMEKLYRLNNFKKTTVGETTAKLLITYHQSINDCYIKNNDENHLLIRSESTLKKVFHETYFYQDEIKYRKKDSDELEKISYDDYLNIYGILPFERNLEGFIVSKNSIISVIQEENDNGYYEYKVLINGEIGSQKIKQRMKTFGDLDDYPIFKNVEITIIMKKDFTPVEIHMNANYNIKYPILGKMNCNQEYVSKYEFNDDIK